MPDKIELMRFAQFFNVTEDSVQRDKTDLNRDALTHWLDKGMEQLHVNARLAADVRETYLQKPVTQGEIWFYEDNKSTDYETRKHVFKDPRKALGYMIDGAANGNRVISFVEAAWIDATMRDQFHGVLDLRVGYEKELEQFKDNARTALILQGEMECSRAKLRQYIMEPLVLGCLLDNRHETRFIETCGARLGVSAEIYTLLSTFAAQLPARFPDRR